MTHVVIYGGGAQTLSHVAPEVVATATFEILDLTRDQTDAARVLSSGSAAVPSFSLTTDAAAGPDQADAGLVSVSSTTGPSIDDECAITAPDGGFELFGVRAISTDAYLRSKSLLAGAYPIGSAVEGVTMTAATTTALHDFDEALLDERPLAIVWTYTVGAGKRIVPESIQLQRSNKAAFDTGPAIEHLLLGWTDLAGRLLSGLTVAQLVRYAERELIKEFALHGIDHHRLMLGDVGATLLAAKALSEAARRGYAPGQRDLTAFAEEARRDYERQFTAITTGRAGSQATRLNQDDESSTRRDPTNRHPFLIGL